MKFFETCILSQFHTFKVLLRRNSDFSVMEMSNDARPVFLFYKLLTIKRLFNVSLPFFIDVKKFVY